MVVGVWPKTRTAPAQNQIRSAELVNYHDQIFKFSVVQIIYLLQILDFHNILDILFIMTKHFNSAQCCSDIIPEYTT